MEQQEGPEAVEQLRRKLKYFFMNPCQKFQARGRKPWKLLLQILKIGLITLQLVIFGLRYHMMVNFKEENLLSFRHLFLKGYKDRRGEADAVYTISEVYEHMSFVIHQYSSLQNVTVGNHEYARREGRDAALTLCWDLYRNSSLFPGNESFYLDPSIETECEDFYPQRRTDAAEKPLNFSLDFKRLLAVRMSLTLKAIDLQTVQHRELPDCYEFDIVVTFNNKAHSGRIKITLDTSVDIKECKDWKVAGISDKHIYYLLLFDCLVILACFTSLVLCCRSLMKGIQLQFEYGAFYKTYCGKPVSCSDRMEFVNGWYILIIISDSLTMIGSVQKMQIQIKDLTNYHTCSILLGTATLLVWVGVVRYLGFFRKYNILVLTLRAAVPNVVRFCCCAAMIYLGYCFCGWIVLGPYHPKFRTLHSVTECLFSLINGDGMFLTFKNVHAKSSLVWLFSRLYLYSYISLFVYVVLSLFIALITDTYETVKHRQQDVQPESELQAFVSQCRDPPASGKATTCGC